MSKRVLTIYTNCSLGGMTSVFRARALENPDVHYDFIFSFDRGGLQTYEALPNCSVRIVRKDRLANYVNYLLAHFTYQEISITSVPDLPGKLNWDGVTSVFYEFHSPVASIVEAELKILDLNAVDEIRAPSDWAADFVRSKLPRRKHVSVRSVPNMIDKQSFGLDGPISENQTRPGMTPLLWIGRFENTQKNYIDFLRVLKLLPDHYYGLMVVSLETDPARTAAMLAAAGYYGVEDRTDIYLNVAQEEMGSIHRMVASRGGVFCSTALSESFGYGVAEAGACGVPVVGYDVGPLAEHQIEKRQLVPVGSLVGMSEAILASSNS
ncbi:glycosyltransferase involved in cell wall biosynthesis [Arthrobacter sp. CAN_A212]|uniref:glycosyltransferase n=1 Tax=Arthrobacter sp. CAN_A212 TaxID=2787719 RepID=UPI0018CA0A60